MLDTVGLTNPECDGLVTMNVIRCYKIFFNPSSPDPNLVNLYPHPLKPKPDIVSDEEMQGNLSTLASSGKLRKYITFLFSCWSYMW